MNTAPMPLPEPVVSTAGPSNATNLWREANLVVAPLYTTWPDRCVRCNAPARGSTKRLRLSWHRPALYLWLLLGPMIYAYAIIGVRKKVVVEVGMCRRHYRRHLLGTVVGALGVVVSAALSFTSCSINPPLLAALGFAGIATSLIAGFVLTRLVSVKKIDRYLYLKCDERFTHSLPSPENEHRESA